MRTSSILLVLCLALIPRPAAATGAVRCDQTLFVPGGDPVTVPGWGDTEADARAQAQRAARVVAQLHFAPTLWNALMFGAGERSEATATALREQAPDEALRLPGYRTEAGACAAEPEGAAAIDREHHRRRTCLVAYKRDFSEAFAAIAHVEFEQKSAMFDEAGAQLWTDLSACYAAPPGTVAAVERTPAAGGEGAVYQCTVYSRQREPQPVAVAWHADLDWAVEIALTERAYAVPRGAFGDAFESVAKASPDMRQAWIAAAVENSLYVVSPSDLSDRAHVRCRQIDAPAAGTLGWTPLDPRTVMECGIDKDPTGALAPYETRESWPQTHQALCSGHLRAGVALTQEAVASASAEMQDTLAMAGWGISAMCEASCLANTRIDGASFTPVATPGVPDRSTAEAAAALLDRAAAERDLELLVLLIPAMDDPRLRDQVAKDGERFWTEMAAAREQGQFDEMFTWTEVEGVWMLAPPER